MPGRGCLSSSVGPAAVVRSSLGGSFRDVEFFVVQSALFVAGSVRGGRRIVPGDCTGV